MDAMRRARLNTAKPRAFPQTLWDLLGWGDRREKSRPVVKAPPKTKGRPNDRPVAMPKSKPAPPLSSQPGRTPSATASGSTSMRDRYDAVTKGMLQDYGLRVRKWRSSMSGVAWQVTYKDGTVSRLIEAPKPKGPMSAAVFLHEVGHHAIGFKTFTPRCLEEYKAWEWSLNAMEANGLNVTDAVHRRMRDSLEYALAKARRRGLKVIPSELAAYFTRSEQYSRLTATVLRLQLGLDPHPSRATGPASHPQPRAPVAHRNEAATPSVRRSRSRATG